MNGDLDKTKFPHGICPFMSGRLAPIAAPGNIVQRGAIAVSTINLPCVGKDCQLWSESSCCLRHISAIAPQLDNAAFHLSNISCHMELPKNGALRARDHALLRIADALELLTDKQKRKTSPVEG